MDPERNALIKQSITPQSTDYIQAFHESREALSQVLAVLAENLEPLLYSHYSNWPSSTLEQKRLICKAVNSDLECLGLTAFSQDLKYPARLATVNRLANTQDGQFSLRVNKEGQLANGKYYRDFPRLTIVPMKGLGTEWTSKLANIRSEACER